MITNILCVILGVTIKELAQTLIESKIKVYAFVGPSGTGKSYRAQMVASEYDVHFIIDDGLLINDNEVIAGVSAKKAPTKIETVKGALFLNNEKADEINSSGISSNVFSCCSSVCSSDFSSVRFSFFLSDSSIRLFSTVSSASVSDTSVLSNSAVPSDSAASATSVSSALII